MRNINYYDNNRRQAQVNERKEAFYFVGFIFLLVIGYVLIGTAY